ncbi:hypothetical protein Q9L58_010900, partial [Maublancomyces gigas]
PWFVADMKVKDISMVRHNIYTLLLDKIDGLSIADSTVFQASSSNLALSRINFLNISGATIFEAGSHNVVLDSITGFNIDAIISRAGWYVRPIFSQRLDNLVMINCVNGTVRLLSDMATGYAYRMDGCQDVKIDVQSKESQHGSGGRHEARIANSLNIAVDHAMSQYSTEGSSTGTILIENSTVAGRITASVGMGALEVDKITVECTGGAIKNIRVATAVAVPTGGSGQLSTLLVKVPAGKILRVKHFAFDYGQAFGTRVKNYFFANTSNTAGARQTTAVEPSRDIIDNSAGSTDIWENIVLYAYNTTGATLVVPIGAQLSVGMILV